MVESEEQKMERRKEVAHEQELRDEKAGKLKHKEHEKKHKKGEEKGDKKEKE